MRIPCLLLVAAGIALAAPGVPGGAAGLDGALVARLAASPPATEASWLAKARKSLQKYAGTEGRPDLRRVVSALVATGRSGTADGPVLAAADTLVTALSDLAGARKTEAEGILAGLKLARDAESVKKALNRADALLAAAGFASDRGARAALLAKAIAAFEKAKGLATKLLLREIRKGLADPAPGDGVTGTLAMLVGTTPWTADEIGAAFDPGTGTLGIRSTQHGNPDLTLEIVITGVTGPGTYALPPSFLVYFVTVNSLPIDLFLTQTGSVTVNSIDGAAGTASGSFSFTALSPYTGAMTVPSGQFSLSGID